MATRRRSARGAFRFLSHGLTLVCVSLPAAAGEWTITPMVSVNETATDNVNLVATNRSSDLVTDVNPGLRIDGAGGRSKLHFDYQLHNLFYARNSDLDRSQNSLNALGTLEAAENWLFIEASAAIAQQSISAFGGATSSTVNTNSSSNTTETGTYRVSPYMRGSFGNLADYLLRYNLSKYTTQYGDAFNSDTNELMGSLKGDTALASLGWMLDARSQTVKFGDGRNNELDLLRGILTYKLDPQLRVLLIAGREANNYLTADKTAYTTKGGGIEWAPTERTLASAIMENRFIGDTYHLIFSHITGGSVWKISKTRDVVVQQNQQGSFAFDPVASSPPTSSSAPVASNYTASSGSPLTINSMISGVTLQERGDVSFALLGARNTLTFAAFNSKSTGITQILMAVPSIGGNYVLSPLIQELKQRGASISWSHQLTGLSSLVASYALINNKGTGATTLETDQKMFNVNLVTRLDPKTSAGVGVRRSVVDGTTNYTENALTGTISYQF
ncbi:MAG: hypothetical protein H6R17_3201 [Proteobacteria bacterium]|nr:hypothetical protein [Pseudomonadota bacterium]